MLTAVGQSKLHTAASATFLLIQRREVILMGCIKGVMVPYIARRGAIIGQQGSWTT